MRGILVVLCVYIEIVVYKEEDVRYIFLSDLHLGSPLFKSEDAIIRLLQNEYDKIFLVGDIVDDWEDNVPSIVSKYNRLIFCINSLSNVVILKGNHDPEIGVLRTIFPAADVFDDYELEGNIMVTHGHRFSKEPWRMTFCIFYMFERIGINLKAFARWIRSWFYDKNELTLPEEKDTVAHYKADYDYVVMGHTHIPKIVPGAECTYVNCGDWVCSKTYVEYEDGKFTLVR